MTRTNTTDQVARAWLAIASLLIIATLVLHGAIAPDLADEMKRVAEAPVRWAVAHWIAAVAFSLYAVTGLIVLVQITTDGELVDPDRVGSGVGGCPLDHDDGRR